MPALSCSSAHSEVRLRGSTCGRICGRKAPTNADQPRPKPSGGNSHPEPSQYPLIPAAVTSHAGGPWFDPRHAHRRDRDRGRLELSPATGPGQPQDHRVAAPAVRTESSRIHEEERGARTDRATGKATRGYDAQRNTRTRRCSELPEPKIRCSQNQARSPAGHDERSAGGRTDGQRSQPATEARGCRSSEDLAVHGASCKSQG